MQIVDTSHVRSYRDLVVWDLQSEKVSYDSELSQNRTGIWLATDHWPL